MLTGVNYVLKVRYTEVKTSHSKEIFPQNNSEVS